MSSLFALHPAGWRIKRLWGVTADAEPWPGLARLVGEQLPLATLPGPAEPQGAAANIKRWAALASWSALWPTLRDSRSRAALLVDDDIVLPPETLAQLAALDAPGVGAVSAVTRCIDGGLPFWTGDNCDRLTAQPDVPFPVRCCGTFCIYLTCAGLDALRRGYAPSLAVPGCKLAGLDLHLTDWLTRNGLTVLAVPAVRVEHHALPGVVLRW